MQSKIELCQSIAYKAHLGQVDKAGKPYINHPKYVAEHCKSDKEKCVAWLHDVIEDSGLTSDDLLKLGVPKDVVKSVNVLTKSKSDGYFDYISKVKKNKMAKNVKIEDLKHNMQLSRLNRIKAKDLIRWIKYRLALTHLNYL